VVSGGGAVEVHRADDHQRVDVVEDALHHPVLDLRAAVDH